MRFIHIADLHLGRRPDISFPWAQEREKELWETFAAIADECRKKAADLLLIAGDLFDAPPSMEELRRANEILERAKPTQAVMISGEHDYIRPGSAYDDFVWASNVHFLKSGTGGSVYLESIDTSVQGASYCRETDASRRPEEIRPDTDSDIRILLAHGGDPEHMPFSPEVLERADYDYVALGHEHTPRLLHGQRMAYAGSLEPLNKDELGKHGYILGEIAAGKTRFALVPFCSREYVTLKVRVSADIRQEELEERLRTVMEKQGSRHIYLITLEGKHGLKRPFCSKSLLDLGNVVEVDDRTVPDYDLVALMDAHKDDVIGMYMEELLKKPSDPKVQRALYCGLDALLFQEEPN